MKLKYPNFSDVFIIEGRKIMAKKRTPVKQENNYADFLYRKTQIVCDHGFDPSWLPDFLFDFQKYLVVWALRKGRAAIFADCGMGKTPMQLVWAENILRKTGKPVLILTPLAVSYQTIKEAAKFGIECSRSHDGQVFKHTTVTNYEQLHKFNPNDFSGVVCDESGILKNFEGMRRTEITEFMRKLPYRLLATATAAPNDFTELGTSSEALGYLGHVDMLTKFFKNDRSNVTSRRMYGEAVEWRFKGHAEIPFWRWVTSWARACRKPSDLGNFEDGKFQLPELRVTEHLVDAKSLASGMLFNLPASTLPEQREERKRTLTERCEMAASLVKPGLPGIVWCHMNVEGDLLEKLIPDCVQISGDNSDDEKEARFLRFISGECPVLVIKPKIGAWGLNFQFCSNIVYFPSHSYESYYQAVRRCWRFGQKNNVTVDLVLTEGERKVMSNLSRKAIQAGVMFENLVREMNNSQGINKVNKFTGTMEVPTWL
jgi:hypothetical protein